MTDQPLKKVLIVDDDKAARDLLRFALEDDKRIEVQLAEDGQSALKKIAASDFDLVILDMMLPRVSGPEIIRQAKNLGKSLSILVVSGAHIDTEAERKLLAEPHIAGVQRKPVRIPRFREAVCEALKLAPLK